MGLRRRCRVEMSCTGLGRWMCGNRQLVAIWKHGIVCMSGE